MQGAGDSGAGVALFDFYSSPQMHLPFNEGYLRIVRAAFGAAPITFHADPDHLANLAPRIADLDISLRPIARFTAPFGLSLHNPIGSRVAAAICLRRLRHRLDGRQSLVGLLGVDAGL